MAQNIGNQLSINAQYNSVTKRMEFTSNNWGLLITQVTNQCGLTSSNFGCQMIIGYYDYNYSCINMKHLSLYSMTVMTSFNDTVSFTATLDAKYFNIQGLRNKGITAIFKNYNRNSPSNESYWLYDVATEEEYLGFDYECPKCSVESIAVNHNLAVANITYLSLPPLQPSAPSSITTTYSCINDDVVITFQSNDSEVEYYSIQRSTSPTSGFTEIATLNTGITKQYIDNNVNYIKYYYKVIAVNNLYSEESSISTYNVKPVISGGVIWTNYPTILAYSATTTNTECDFYDSIKWYLDGTLVGTTTTPTFNGTLPDDITTRYLTAKFYYNGVESEASNQIGLRFVNNTIVLSGFTTNVNFVIPAGYNRMDYLIVAGGGVGGNTVDNSSNNSGADVYGGGGGAGGYLEGTVNNPTPGTYPVVIGSGGTRNQFGTILPAGNSTFYNLTAIGGGYGGSASYSNNIYGSADNGGNGGSGGGGGGTSQWGGSGFGIGLYGSGTTNQGNNGASGVVTTTFSGARGGGGGGALSVASGVNGGQGKQSSISGILTTYAEGGSARTTDGNGVAPLTYGSGGGGSAQIDGDSTSRSGADGYQGIVYVKLYNVYPQAPTSPTGLTSTNITCKSATLNWVNTDTTEVTGIYLQQYINGEWTTIQTLANNVTTYNVSGLTPITNYRYRLVPYNELYMVNSDELSFNTINPTPYNLNYNLNSTYIDLYWNLGCDYGTEIQVKLREVNGEWSTIQTLSYTATSTNYGLLEYNKSYEMQVVLIGSEWPSTIIQFSTPTFYSPSNLTTTSIEGTEICISWVNNSINDSINVYVDGNVVANLPSTSTEYCIPNLNMGTEYTIYVSNVDNGVELNSNEITVTIEYFYSPSNLTTTSLSPNEICIAWVNNSINDSINVYVNGNVIANLPATTTEYCIPDLNMNTEYTIYVTTVYDGIEKESNIITVTTPIEYVTPFCEATPYTIHNSECNDNTGYVQLTDINYLYFYTIIVVDINGNVHNCDDNGKFEALVASFYTIIATPHSLFWNYYNREACIQSFIIEDSDTTMSINKYYIKPSLCTGFDRQQGRIGIEINDSIPSLTYNAYLYDLNNQLIQSVVNNTDKLIVFNNVNKCYRVIIINSNGCHILIDNLCVPNSDMKTIDGVAEVFIAENNTNIDFDYYSTTDDEYFITDIDNGFFLSTMIKRINTQLQWMSLPIHNNQVSFTQTLNKSRQGFNFEDVININIAKQTSDKLDDLLSIIDMNKFIVVFKDNNQQYWVTGHITPVKLNTIKANIGRRSESNEYQLEIKGYSADSIITSIDKDWVINNILN
jgi:hypothetical protein